MLRGVLSWPLRVMPCPPTNPRALPCRHLLGRTSVSPSRKLARSSHSSHVSNSRRHSNSCSLHHGSSRRHSCQNSSWNRKWRRRSRNIIHKDLGKCQWHLQRRQRPCQRPVACASVRLRDRRRIWWIRQPRRCRCCAALRLAPGTTKRWRRPEWRAQAADLHLHPARARCLRSRQGKARRRRRGKHHQ